METKQQTEFEKKIKESNAAIEEAIKILDSTDRGHAVIYDLKQIFRGQASGLDTIGMQAMLTLCHEFCTNQRRGFLDKHILAS